MPLTKEKRKLNKLIQQSDSDESEHELSYYVNDRIKLMKEVLKIVKPKKIKLMAPSCLRNVDSEEINSMLLEELLGISNKRLKYIFNGQSLDEDSSTTSEDNHPIDVISLDDISDDELVINVDDDEDTGQKKDRKDSKHRKCKRSRTKNSVKLEIEKNEKLPEGENEIGSNKNLMSVLELLELQARARAIKSQLLLENAKTQESISLSKIPTIEEKVGSDDEVIIQTTKTEEIIITSSDSEYEGLINDTSEKNNEEFAENIDIDKQKKDIIEVEKLTNIKVIENKELTSDELFTNENNIEEEINREELSDKKVEICDENKEKSLENDEIIQINLSDDEMNELK